MIGVNMDAVSEVVADATRTPRRRENTRARLMDAALEVFAEEGLEGASVESICERAGFTRGAFYSNFESKNELFLAVISHLFDEKLHEIAQRITELTADELDNVDTVEVINRVAAVAFTGGMNPALLSEFRTQALRDPQLGKAYLAWQDGTTKRVAEIVTQFADVYGYRLRLPAAEVAELLVEVSDEACVRAALEGLDDAATTAALTARIARVALALIDVG